LSRFREKNQRVGDPNGIKILLALMCATIAGNQAYQEKMYEIQGDAKEEMR